MHSMLRRLNLLNRRMVPEEKEEVRLRDEGEGEVEGEDGAEGQ